MDERDELAAGKLEGEKVSKRRRRKRTRRKQGVFAFKTSKRVIKRMRGLVDELCLQTECVTLVRKVAVAVVEQLATQTLERPVFNVEIRIRYRNRVR